LQAQAWRLLARCGVVLRRNKHDRLSKQKESGASQAGS
jgi:hypothetical protein